MHDSFAPRLDPGLELQSHVAAFLPDVPCPRILDVGAGPLTILGKRLAEKDLSIVAVDPLADEYDKLLDRYAIVPPVRTIVQPAETLSKRFSPDSSDLVYARNCFEHSYDPIRAMQQMLHAV
jgi:SAM-dependent methyltransferase